LEWLKPILKDIFISVFVAAIIGLFGAYINGIILETKLAQFIENQKELKAEVNCLKETVNRHYIEFVGFKAKAEAKSETK